MPPSMSRQTARRAYSPASAPQTSSLAVTTLPSRTSSDASSHHAAAAWPLSAQTEVLTLALALVACPQATASGLPLENRPACHRTCRPACHGFGPPSSRRKRPRQVEQITPTTRGRMLHIAQSPCPTGTCSRHVWSRRPPQVDEDSLGRERHAEHAEAGRGRLVHCASRLCSGSRPRDYWPQIPCRNHITTGVGLVDLCYGCRNSHLLRHWALTTATVACGWVVSHLSLYNHLLFGK